MDIQEVTIDDDYDDGSDDGDNEFDFLSTSTAIQPISRKNQRNFFLEEKKINQHKNAYISTIKYPNI